MEVFAVTIFVSLMFAVLFAALFVAERSQRRRSSIEQDALLPFDEFGGGKKAQGATPEPTPLVLSPVPVHTQSHPNHRS